MNKQHPSTRADKRYWQRTRRMTLWLLLFWFAVTFSTIFFARDLAAYTLFGWPFSFFMAAQGSTLIFAAIVAFYAWCMRDFDDDHQHDHNQDQDSMQEGASHER